MKDLMSAISAAQDDIGMLTKDADGYGYKYVSYGELVSKTRHVLREHGLLFTHSITNNEGAPALLTQLWHLESGEFLAGRAVLHKSGITKANESQQWGSDVTYMRRYQEMAMLDIPHGDDADEKRFNKPRSASPVAAPPSGGTSMSASVRADLDNCTSRDGVSAVFSRHALDAEADGWKSELEASCRKRVNDLGGE